MLTRYQTGPVATILVIAVSLALCAFFIFDALHFHNRTDWLKAAFCLLVLFNFHRLFRQPKD